MSTPASRLERFLTEMEYPATRDDLLREASRDGLAPADIAVLRALPERGYDARRRVQDALQTLAGMLVPA